ncbi:piwi domain-containing protein [Colletotrichum abscissum]|uniref:piwi domain-containing protein n=1 Tax=Colletotrichum abscissum TaxID=1671311 RepID=UPI0027D73802|nr:piwi domain-containing protein [Colletotrichum abscissum]KAK1509317.1 piwi domain-containing protein [Colletotrichum abscissum]
MPLYGRGAIMWAETFITYGFSPNLQSKFVFPAFSTILFRVDAGAILAVAAIAIVDEGPTAASLLAVEHSKGSVIPEPDIDVTNLENTVVQRYQSKDQALVKKMGSMKLTNSTVSLMSCRPAFGAKGKQIVVWTNYFRLLIKPVVLYRYNLEVRKGEVADAPADDPKGKRKGKAQAGGGGAGGSNGPLTSVPKRKLKIFKSQFVSLDKLQLVKSPIVVKLKNESAMREELYNVRIVGETEAPLAVMAQCLRDMVDPSNPDDAHFSRFETDVLVSDLCRWSGVDKFGTDNINAQDIVHMRLRGLSKFLAKTRVTIRFRTADDKDVTAKKAIHGLACSRDVDRTVIFSHSFVYGGPQEVRFQLNPAEGQTKVLGNKPPGLYSAAEYWRWMYEQAPGKTLPLVNLGTPSKPMFFPAERCTITAGQAVRSKLSGDGTTAMLDFACLSPFANAVSIERDSAAALGLDEPILKDFGITVDKRLLTVVARKLAAPVVTSTSYPALDMEIYLLPAEQQLWKHNIGTISRVAVSEQHEHEHEHISPFITPHGEEDGAFSLRNPQSMLKRNTDDVWK